MAALHKTDRREVILANVSKLIASTKASLTITRQGFMIALAFAILTLYLFPLFLIVDVAIKSDGFQEEITGSGFGWFVAFLKHSDSTLGQFHKILFPILTGLSVVMLKDPITKTYAFLVAYILFGLPSPSMLVSTLTWDLP